MLVYREDVDIDATFLEDSIIAIVLVQDRASISKFGIFEEIVRVGLSALLSHRIIQFLRQDFQHPQVILTKHLNIHIVTPRNEPLMASCTNQRSTYQPITNLMALANSVKRQQKFHHAMLMNTKQGALWVESRL